MKTVFELLNHDNTISEAVIYAALLAKHAWYEQHGKLSDGWFYSTVDDMEESTSLTKCQQSRCIKRLVSAGLIRCAAKGLPARRFFYIVDDPQLLEGIIGVCEPSTEENAPAVRSETSPQEVRKSDGWQAVRNPHRKPKTIKQKKKILRTSNPTARSWKRHAPG